MSVGNDTPRSDQTIFKYHNVSDSSDSQFTAYAQPNTVRFFSPRRAASEGTVYPEELQRRVNPDNTQYPTPRKSVSFDAVYKNTPIRCPFRVCCCCAVRRGYNQYRRFGLMTRIYYFCFRCWRHVVDFVW